MKRGGGVGDGFLAVWERFFRGMVTLESCMLGQNEHDANKDLEELTVSILGVQGGARP